MMFKLIKTYTDVSTAHCVKYIGRKDFTVYERIFWLISVMTFIFFAAILGTTLWCRFKKMPVETIIKDIHYPLAKFPFPAVTMCPTHPIKESVGIPYLKRYFNSTEEENNKVLKGVIKLLSLTRYPSFFYMKDKVANIKHYLQYFDKMNVSDFMLESLPLCTDIFEMCYWNGERKNCCEILSLQRTEEGYCYSFNSLTAETKKECYIRDFFIQSLLLNDQKQHCTPKHTTSSGRYSGLTVVLKKDDELLQNGFSRGINVLISSTYELAEAGSGVVLKRKPGRMLEIEITPIIIECSSKLISYSSKQRECVLPQERTLKFNKFYSQTNCLIECRHNFIIKNCNCQPYFFKDVTTGLPECNLDKLRCLANLSAEIRVMADSVYSNSILNMTNNTDCSCPVPCYDTMYNSLIKHSNLSVFDGKIQHGLLDVHFSKLGAVKYLRKISFSQEELIVSIGGTGNLFLGCSAISLMELVYYFLRGCVELLNTCLRKCQQRFTRTTRVGFYN